LGDDNPETLTIRRDSCRRDHIQTNLVERRFRSDQVLRTVQSGQDLHQQLHGDRTRRNMRTYPERRPVGAGGREGVYMDQAFALPDLGPDAGAVRVREDGVGEAQIGKARRLLQCRTSLRAKALGQSPTAQWRPLTRNRAMRAPFSARRWRGCREESARDSYW
jgi:hypothetical protein